MLYSFSIFTPSGRSRPMDEGSGKNHKDFFPQASLFFTLHYRMVASMVYYGLSLNAGDLSGNIYVNFVLLATAELASFLFSLFIMDITGRKKLQFSSMILGGIACMATMFPVMYGGKGEHFFNMHVNDELQLDQLGPSSLVLCPFLTICYFTYIKLFPFVSIKIFHFLIHTFTLIFYLNICFRLYWDEKRHRHIV